MQVTLLVVGLIVGFAVGLGAGWYLWRGEEGRQGRTPQRRPRSHEPSTPPQHRPTPRPRPIVAMRPATQTASVAGPAAGVGPVPAPADRDRPAYARSEPDPVDGAVPPFAEAPTAAAMAPSAPEPLDAYEYRPTPRRERPVSIEEPQHADRRVLQELLEANRRLTADAELRLRREGGAAADQLQLGSVPTANRLPVSTPAPDDLVARHRKLEEDSRRMSRREGESHG